MKYSLGNSEEINKVLIEIDSLLRTNGYICIDDFLVNEKSEAKFKIKQEVLNKYEVNSSNGFSSLVKDYNRIKNKYSSRELNFIQNNFLKTKNQISKLDSEIKKLNLELKKVDESRQTNQYRIYFFEDLVADKERSKDDLYRNAENEDLESIYKDSEIIQSELRDIYAQIDNLRMKYQLDQSKYHEILQKLFELKESREQKLVDESNFKNELLVKKAQINYSQNEIEQARNKIINSLIYSVMRKEEKLYIFNRFKYRLDFIEETNDLYELIERNKVQNKSNFSLDYEERLFDKIIQNFTLLSDYNKKGVTLDLDNINRTLMEDFLDFYKLMKKKSKATSEKILFYRGHTNSNYLSVPSIFREKGYIENEHIMFREIQVRCSDEMLALNTYLEKLTTMQHYSLPTRLLDITSSILVALFFAVENDFKMDGELIVYGAEKDDIKYFDSDTVEMLSALAILNSEDKKDLLNETVESIRNLIKISLPNVSKNRSVAFMKNLTDMQVKIIGDFNSLPVVKKLSHEVRKQNQIALEEINPIDLLDICFVKPVLNNNRIIRQQGAFIVNGLLDKGKGTQRYRMFEWNQSAEVETYVNYLDEETKISLKEHVDFNKIIIRNIIPSIKKKELKAWLKDLSMDESVIYPDFENIARYLKKAYSKIDSSE